MGANGRIATIVGVALLLRLAALIFFSHPEVLEGEFVFQHDELEYHQIASSLAESGEYSLEPGGPATIRRSPGLVLPIALLYGLFRPSPVMATGYVMLCSLLLVPILAAIGWQTCKSQPVVLGSALIGASLPSLIFTSTGIWSEPQAILLTMLALLLLLQVNADSALGLWALLGFFLSLSYLTRTAALFLIVLVFLKILSDGNNRKRRVGLLLMILALVAPILSWGMWNTVKVGRFFVSEGTASKTLWESNNPVTAGLVLPAMKENNGVDLETEAMSGAYEGSWVPQEYIGRPGKTRFGRWRSCSVLCLPVSGRTVCDGQSKGLAQLGGGQSASHSHCQTDCGLNHW